MGLTGDSGLQIVGGGAEGHAGGRIATGLQIFQVAMGMAGLALRGGAEQGGDIVVTFHIGLGGEVEVTAVGLGFASKCVFQILFGLTTFEFHVFVSECGCYVD